MQKGLLPHTPTPQNLYCYFSLLQGLSCSEEGGAVYCQHIKFFEKTFSNALAHLDSIVTSAFPVISARTSPCFSRWLLKRTTCNGYRDTTKKFIS